MDFSNDHVTKEHQISVENTRFSSMNEWRDEKIFAQMQEDNNLFFCL